ncbi:N-acetyltransferase [Peribacillus frigoritolerans]|nr:N-acetyltransferase [Peribacillus frigoritolerans]
MANMMNFSKELDRAEEEYLQLFCRVKDTALYKAFRDDALKGMYSHHFAKMTTPYHPILLREVLAASKQALNRSFIHVKLPYNARVDKKMLSYLTSEDYFCDLDLYYYHDLKQVDTCTRIITKLGEGDALRDACRAMELYDARHINASFAKNKMKRKKPFYLSKEIRLYVCYEDGVPIGSAELYISPVTNIAKIEEVAILDEYQRKGYGSSFMKFLLNEAKQLGAACAYLITVNEASSRTFYEKLGFVKVLEQENIFKNLI